MKLKKVLLYIGLSFTMVCGGIALKVWFDISTIKKEYKEVEKVDISDVLNQLENPNKELFKLDPLVYEIKEIYSSELYKNYLISDVTDMGKNIFSKKNMTKTEQIIKNDFEKLLNKYIKTPQLFDIQHYLLTSSKDIGVLLKYEIVNFYDYLISYIYFLQKTEQTELSQKLLNKLIFDLNHSMEQSSYIDFILSLMIYDQLHSIDLCSYKNKTTFQKENTKNLKNMLYERLHNEIIISSYLIKVEVYDKMDKNINQENIEEAYIHTIKSLKHYLLKFYKTLKTNDINKIDEFEKKIENLTSDYYQILFRIFLPEYLLKDYFTRTITSINILKQIGNYKKTLVKIDENIQKFSTCK